jgi:hypothetical protein
LAIRAVVSKSFSAKWLPREKISHYLYRAEVRGALRSEATAGQGGQAKGAIIAGIGQ